MCVPEIAVKAEFTVVLGVEERKKEKKEKAEGSGYHGQWLCAFRALDHVFG
jgi:hypothetical protein